jgi:copper chaperone CopZ
LPSSDPNHLQFEITGLSCAGCVARAEKSLNAVPEVLGADVNLTSRTAQVWVSGTETAPLSAALEKAGYPAATEDLHLLFEPGSVFDSDGLVTEFTERLGVLSAWIEHGGDQLSLGVKVLKGAFGLSDLAAVLSRFDAEPVLDSGIIFKIINNDNVSLHNLGNTFSIVDSP